MAVSLQSIMRGGSDRAPMVVIHSSPGMGKTTFAASAPDPVFIRTEDGLGDLNVNTFPLLASVQDVMDALASLYEDGHGFKTVVIDSLSALEPLIWDRVAQDHQVDSIEGLGYGKGYVYAMAYWREIVSACYGLAQRGVMPIMIAHSEVVKFDAPDADPYDRYQIKLHKRTFAHLYEQADVIGFAHEPVYVRKENDKDTKGKAKPKGERQLRVVQSPAVIAKNRYHMPETMPLDWDAFAAYLPNIGTTEGDSNHE